MPFPAGGPSAESAPSPRLVHSALLIAQIFFGVGSVVGSLGLPSMNPLAFALYREITASVILLFAATSRLGRAGGPGDPKKPALEAFAWLAHRRSFIILGALIFGNQAG